MENTFIMWLSCREANAAEENCDVRLRYLRKTLRFQNTERRSQRKEEVAPHLHSPIGPFSKHGWKIIKHSCTHEWKYNREIKHGKNNHTADHWQCSTDSVTQQPAERTNLGQEESARCPLTIARTNKKGLKCSEAKIFCLKSIWDYSISDQSVSFEICYNSSTSTYETRHSCCIMNYRAGETYNREKILQ